MDLREVLRDYEQRFRAQVDRVTIDIVDLRNRGKAAITRADGQASALDLRLKPLENAGPQVLARLTALENRVTAAEAELVKLDPTYVPPTG